MIPMLFLLAAQVSTPQHPVPFMREIRQGPMPFQERTMSQPHRFSDDRMFPDIAVKDMRIDGDTLYVLLVNQGRGSARVPIVIVARAAANGLKSEEVQGRTPRLAAGESRWIALKGFSVKSAAMSAPVFDLAAATAVSAAAWLSSSTPGNVDRSGQGCGECSTDSDQRNNILNLFGKSVIHGSPSH